MRFPAGTRFNASADANYGVPTGMGNDLIRLASGQPPSPEGEGFWAVDCVRRTVPTTHFYIRSGASTPIRYRACFSVWRTASVSIRRAARVPGSSTITLFS